jgi:hypothetical protein
MLASTSIYFKINSSQRFSLSVISVPASIGPVTKLGYWCEPIADVATGMDGANRQDFCAAISLKKQ